MKTILYGAFGRHNFGDMLFPHIVHRLIKKNINESEIEFCDILSRDMRKYGGHNVKSICDFLDYEKSISLISVGGEIGSCDLENAITMFSPSGAINASEVIKLRDADIRLAYLIEKGAFKNPDMFICNGIGGINQRSFNIIKKYNYNAFRDTRSFLTYEKARETSKLNIAGQRVPDSVVMLRHFFDQKIVSRLRHSKSLQNLNKLTGEDYIVIQFKPSHIGKSKRIISELKIQFQRLIHELNIPIVFFCAGTAPGHDSIEVYKEEFNDSLPKDMTCFYTGENIWDICNLISRATCVIGTSLHVRVVASQYARPRISINLKEFDKKEASQYTKTSNFINEWDSIKNTEFKIVNLVDNIKEAINQNNLEFQFEHNEKLQNIFLERSTWLEQLSRSVGD